MLDDDEFDDGLTDEEQENNVIPEYSDLVTEYPELEVDISEYTAPKSVTEAEEDDTHISNIQAILRVLNANSSNKRIAEFMHTAKVSRVFPDNLIDKHFLIASTLIEAHDPRISAPDVPLIISQVQDGLSMAYEGRFIADLLELAGIASQEDIDKLSKELGL